MKFSRFLLWNNDDEVDKVDLKHFNDYDEDYFNYLPAISTSVST